MKKHLLIIFILICITEISVAQTTTTSTFRPATPAFSGWDGTGPNAGTYDVKNNFNYPINFWTNTNWHATLDVNGNFSIGQTNANNYFGIGADKILWHNGNTQDIFVGVGAGNNFMTGHYNSYFGNGAGASTAAGINNTAVGYQAFTLGQDLHMNTAIGYQALGAEATCPLCWDGQSSINTAVGFQALYNTQAYGDVL